MAITLKAARVNAGLTRTEAAARIGVSPDTLANWERGKTAPSAIKLPAIESAYGIAYEQLIFLPQNNR